MKFIITLLFVLLLGSNLLLGQISKLPEGSDLADDDVTAVTDVSDKSTNQNGKTKQYDMTAFAAYMFGADRTMPGKLTLEQPLRLSTAQIAGYINSVRINESGRIASTDASGEEVQYATTQELADAGLGTETDYARTTITNDFDLRQDFNSGVNISGKADMSNAETIIKEYSSLPEFTDGKIHLFVYDGYLYITTTNGTNIKIAKWSEIGGGYLPSTGSLEGASFQITIIDGAYGFIWDGDGVLAIPELGVSSISGARRIAGDDDYFYYQGQNLLNETAVENKVKEIIKYEVPEIEDSATDTLSFDGTNYLTRFGSQGAQTVLITDYQPNIVNVTVESQEGVTFDFGSVSIETDSGLPLPAFNDGYKYLVTFIYETSTVCIATWMKVE